MKSPAIYNKANQTKLERYGNSIVTRLDWVKTKIRRGIKSKIFDKFIKRISDEYTPLFSKDDFIANVEPKRKWKWKHNKCGKIFESRYQYPLYPRCSDCCKSNRNSSKGEYEIVIFL